MSDETHPENTTATEANASGEPEDLRSDDDGLVEGQIQITVMPDSVSMHYRVKPTAEKAHISNLTASFVAKKDGMVVESFAGNSVQALEKTTEGQGFTGDMGTDIGVFSDRPKGGLFGLVAGVCHDGEGNPHNFIFTRQFHLDD